VPLRLVSLLPGANSGRALDPNRSMRLKNDCKFSYASRQVSSTSKQSRWQPETACQFFPRLMAISSVCAWTLSILARAYRSSSASCSRTSSSFLRCNARQGVKCRNFGQWVLAV